MYLQAGKMVEDRERRRRVGGNKARLKHYPLERRGRHGN